MDKIKAKLLATIDPACDHCQYVQEECKEDGHFFCKEQVRIIHALYQQEIDRFRVLLWKQHPCEAKYGDDGELQCNRLPFFIDFKRDPVERIERYCAIHNCQRQGISIPDFLLKGKEYEPTIEELRERDEHGFDKS